MIFQLDQKNQSSIALIDADQMRQISYGELVDRVSRSAAFLSDQHASLVVLAASNSVDSIVAYLSCLEAGITVALVEAKENVVAAAILSAYQPTLVLGENLSVGVDCVPIKALPDSQCMAFGYLHSSTSPVHKSLALMLPTSGSTGSPKFVRLSKTNLESNAASIAEYLALGVDERAMQSLPAHYSYGLSVLNSHLIVGACIVLTSHSFLRGPFWEAFRKWQCTSFAGVPFMYETLARLRFQPSKYESLRYMTQAGGRLNPDVVSLFEERCRHSQRRFFVMYGQTEATARISYVPSERLQEKCGSVGIAIPGGDIHLQEVEGHSELTEIVYEGPNVMLGYAESRECLAKGDEMHGILPTGDLGRIDEDGFVYIVGRLKRFAKLYGSRVSLDDIEAFLESQFAISVVAKEMDAKLRVFYASSGDTDDGVIRSTIARYLTVPLDTFVMKKLDAIPVTSSGKKDYQSRLL